MQSRCVLVVVVLLSSCGTTNELGGSIGADYSLAFDRVEASEEASALRLDYLAVQAEGIETVCRIVLDTSGIDSGSELELEGAALLERLRVQRITTQGAGFPSPTWGRLVVRWGTNQVQGAFEMVFRTGQTLHGRFLTELTSTRGE